MSPPVTCNPLDPTPVHATVQYDDGPSSDVPYVATVTCHDGYVVEQGVTSQVTYCEAATVAWNVTIRDCHGKILLLNLFGGFTGNSIAKLK